MKKVVIFKNKKLTEDTPDLRGAAINISKGDRRIIRVRRAAEAAEEAAIQARQHGNEETAVELEDRAAALRQWAKEAAEDDYAGKGQNSRNNAENSETAQSSAKNSPEEEVENNKEERMKAMLAVLKQLKKGEQAGAKDALQNILSQVNQAQSTKEALQEAFTLPNISLNDISDDELDDIINSIYLEVDKVKPINRSTPMDVRVAEIERTSAKDAEDINIEDNSVLKDERAAARARKRSMAAYSSVANLGGLAAFKQSLWRAIKSQVSKVDADDTSWGVINRRHQDDDIVAPGSYTDEINRKNSIPAIRVYFDCSGSFNEDDINKVKNVLAVLDEFEQQKKITTELIYFADHLHSTYAAARKENGTDAWPYIVDDLQKSAPTNVIIITDRDMYWDAKSLGQSYVANGCVWYIWKKSKADNLPEYVKGRKGTYEFQLD